MSTFHRLVARSGLIFGLILVLVLTTAAVPAHAGKSFSMALTGAAEVPGPGDPDGSGMASVTLNAGQEMVCWKISVDGIMLPATGAHIHRGAVDDFGPVVVGLAPPDASGESSGCTTAARELIVEILTNPEMFYVNVHSTEYPAGAVRGQLGR
jgi:hypothetical protein